MHSHQLRETASSLIIASKADQASLNITNNLISHHGFVRSSDNGHWETFQNGPIRLLLGQKECIYVEPGDVLVSANRIIFVSKHRSNRDQPALTVHTTGNLGAEARYGGNPSEVSWVDANLLKEALSALKHGVEYCDVKIEVTMEATHHGPTSFTVPVCFVEVGSTPREFSDPVLGRIAADATMTALSSENHHSKSTVGFGGTHYSSKLSMVNMTDDKFAIGHLVPKHAFEAGLTDNVLRSTFEKTVEGCKTALIDWKGLKGQHRQTLLDRLAQWNVEIVRI